MMIDSRIRMGGGLQTLGAVPRMYYTRPRYHPLRPRFGYLGQSSQSITQMIQAAAAAQGVPPNLAVAVAQHESNLNQAAIGTSGEIGVFQLMPGTASDLGVDPTNLQQNINGGVSYLKQMYGLTGNWNDALVAYNEGPGAWSSGTVVPSSASYATQILAAAGMSDSTTTSAGVDQGQVMPVGTSGTDDSGQATATDYTPLLIAAAIIGVFWLTA